MEGGRLLVCLGMSRLRFHLRRSGYGGQVATLDMTTSYIYPVLVHEPIGAAPIKVLDMTPLLGQGVYTAQACQFGHPPEERWPSS